MRLIASVLLGGICSLASCLARETPPGNSGASGAGGALIDGEQVCVDFCILANQVCSDPSDHCVGMCEEKFRNGGAECYDEQTEAYTCLLAAQTNECAGNPPECEPKLSHVDVCVQQFGFKPYGKCQADTGPSGETACNCEGTHTGVHYNSKCWSTGVTSACECLVDDVSVGTCAGDAEPFCDTQVYLGCCNEYFMLPF